MAKKKQRKMRVYVHPEEEALSHGMGVWLPGDEIPAKALAELPPEVIKNWNRNNLIIREDLFQQYFPEAWNKKHSRIKKMKHTTLNPDVKLGDEFTDQMSPEDVRTVT